MTARTRRLADAPARELTDAQRAELIAANMAPGTTPEGRVQSRHLLPARTVRVADEDWAPAMAAAKADGTNVSAIVRDALRAYVEARATSEAVSAHRRAVLGP